MARSYWFSSFFKPSPLSLSIESKNAVQWGAGIGTALLPGMVSLVNFGVGILTGEYISIPTEVYAATAVSGSAIGTLVSLTNCPEYHSNRNSLQYHQISEEIKANISDLNSIEARPKTSRYPICETKDQLQKSLTELYRRHDILNGLLCERIMLPPSSHDLTPFPNLQEEKEKFLNRLQEIEQSEEYKSQKYLYEEEQNLFRKIEKLKRKNRDLKQEQEWNSFNFQSKNADPYAQLAKVAIDVWKTQRKL